MIRLKSMYVLVGGDIHHLQKEGLFEQYYGGNNENEDFPVLRRKEKSSKVKRSSSAPSKYN